MPETLDRTRVTPRRRSARASTRASKLCKAMGPCTGARLPEWTTERWKRRVEAEARLRLKRNIRGSAESR